MSLPLNTEEEVIHGLQQVLEDDDGHRCGDCWEAPKLIQHLRLVTDLKDSDYLTGNKGLVLRLTTGAEYIVYVQKVR